MRLTRRDVHKGFAALAATAFTARMGVAAPDVPGADDVFLNRLTFGATPESRADLAALGRQAWLDAQLDMPADSPEMQARLDRVQLRIVYEAGETEVDEDTVISWDAVDAHRPLRWLNAPPEELVTLLDWYSPIAYAERARPAIEVQAASFVRAVHSPAQLREVMTQFWHDHFNVNTTKDEVTAALFPAYDRDMRAHALGNFRDLLWASATAPVMLRYLNNDESQASPANENYARELLELHTLGQGAYFNDLYENWRDVPGAVDGLAEGYIDDDVYEVARALTGWSIGDGRYVDDGSTTPTTGKLAYVESWHDPYQKRFLGIELEANSGPLEDGKKVLEVLANHPATARFVTGKMLRRLGIEAPSAAYRATIAAVFTAQRDQPDQIAQTIRAIVDHPEFAATPPTKLRRPFEFLAAFLRASGADIAPSDTDYEWLLGQTGWRQHAVAPPTGHSDHTIDWADTRTISGILNLALEAHGDWLNLTADNTMLRRYDGVTDMAGLAAHWADRFGLPPGDLAPAVKGLGMSPQDAIPFDDEGWHEWLNTGLVAYAAHAPSFLYR